MKISQEHSEKIAKLRQELKSRSPESSEDYSELELDSYLKFQRSIPAAAKALLASRKWKRENPVTIKHVAQFIRAPEGKTTPPGCLVCLEDGKGDVARDTEGRPIICMIGMVYGTEQELKQQIAYALRRAAKYRLPHHRPDEVHFITEVSSRETGSLGQTFRFPDAAVRSLFDFMKAYYPGSQFSIVQMCGLPSFIVHFFKMLKPFVSEEIFGRLKLKPSFKHLKKDGYVAPDSLLPNWDKEGTFRFDLDEYVEWRAKEEGIPLSKVCPRGQGRKYDGNILFSMNITVSLEEVMGTPEKKERVIKSGWAEKQGSGMGLFSSNRWKSKYLVLTPGVLFYFENNKMNASNAASRVIAIDETSTVGRVAGERKAMVCFQSAEREYVFGFASDKEADDWVELLQKECEEQGAAERVKPSKVESLCVGDYDFSKTESRLSTTILKQ